MADSNSLKVMCIFETGARIKSDTEILSLAAHIYHRFFRLKQQMNTFELFTFCSACIKLAYNFYEKPLIVEDLALAMASVVHGPKFCLNSDASAKLEQSIESAAKIIAINLDFEIDYKNNRMMTPGLLSKSIRARDQQDAGQITVVTLDKSDDEEEEEEDQDEAERLLTKNSKHSISSHRYLAHYLKTIKLLVDPSSLNHFKRFSNIAWTFLTDFYWSPCVTQHYAEHLACACLMMAVEACREALDVEKPAAKFQLWKLIDKKWNLILCDDLNDEHLERIIVIIVKQYEEYERALQHELNVYVIDPKEREHTR